MNDAMDSIVEMTSGYRQKLLAAGFGDFAADSMCTDFHRMLIESAIRNDSKKKA